MVIQPNTTISLVYIVINIYSTVESGGWVEFGSLQDSSFARTHQVFQTEISAEKPVNR